jgi:hypothetical protein
MNIIQEHTMHSAGWALLHFLWQGALIGLALKITLAALRSRSAQSRYLAPNGVAPKFRRITKLLR